MSSLFWGILMVVIGLLLTIGGWTESQFWLYRLLVARSKMLWKDQVHKFYRVVGIIIIIFGIFMAFDLI